MRFMLGTRHCAGPVTWQDALRQYAGQHRVLWLIRHLRTYAGAKGLFKRQALATLFSPPPLLKRQVALYLFFLFLFLPVSLSLPSSFISIDKLCLCSVCLSLTYHGLSHTAEPLSPPRSLSTVSHYLMHDLKRVPPCSIPLRYDTNIMNTCEV